MPSPKMVDRPKSPPVNIDAYSRNRPKPHLGTGGMGEVYRARDNKLQREVALKVLPEQFAQDPERVARFRREAQVLAQLNHVNIAAIYSVEESGGTHFLVMELALGETLGDRIKRGPVPIEEDIERPECLRFPCRILTGKERNEALEYFP